MNDAEMEPGACGFKGDVEKCPKFNFLLIELQELKPLKVWASIAHKSMFNLLIIRGTLRKWSHPKSFSSYQCHKGSVYFLKKPMLTLCFAEKIVKL